MAKRKTKEDEQKALEDKRKLRTKQLAQLKASNEMLEEAKADIFISIHMDSFTSREASGTTGYPSKSERERVPACLPR